MGRAGEGAAVAISTLRDDLSPSQSDDLIHFTGRNGARRPDWVDADILGMTAKERLGAIVRDGRMRTFAPYGGATMRCACFSEANPEHLSYLLGKRRYLPFGIVVTRSQVLEKGGGTVAYIQDELTREEFTRAKLGHWVVRTEYDSDWTHEREWRIPWKWPRIRWDELRAILVPNTTWRPVPPGEELPALWLKSPIWVWNSKTRKAEEHAPGTLV